MRGPVSSTPITRATGFPVGPLSEPMKLAATRPRPAAICNFLASRLPDYVVMECESRERTHVVTVGSNRTAYEHHDGRRKRWRCGQRGGDRRREEAIFF